MEYFAGDSMYTCISFLSVCIETSTVPTCENSSGLHELYTEETFSQ